MKSHVLHREEQAGDPSSKVRNLAMLGATCVEEERLLSNLSKFLTSYEPAE